MKVLKKTCCLEKVVLECEKILIKKGYECVYCVGNE